MHYTINLAKTNFAGPHLRTPTTILAKNHPENHLFLDHGHGTDVFCGGHKPIGAAKNIPRNSQNRPPPPTPTLRHHRRKPCNIKKYTTHSSLINNTLHLTTQHIDVNSLSIQPRQ